MKSLLGSSHLQWDTKHTQGAYAGRPAYDAAADYAAQTSIQGKYHCARRRPNPYPRLRDGVARSRGASTPSTRTLSRRSWTPPRAVVPPSYGRRGGEVGRGVVGGPAVVGALRVLRVPLEVTGTQQALHRVAALVLAKQLRLAHAGPRTELVALVLGRRRRVVPVAGHLLLDGVLWAVCHPWSQGLDCPAKVVDDGSQLGASWSAGAADSSVAGEGACY